MDMQKTRMAEKVTQYVGMEELKEPHKRSKALQAVEEKLLIEIRTEVKDMEDKTKNRTLR